MFEIIQNAVVRAIEPLESQFLLFQVPDVLDENAPVKLRTHGGNSEQTNNVCTGISIPTNSENAESQCKWWVSSTYDSTSVYKSPR